MSGIATAIVGGAVISGVASSKAASKAAGATTAAAERGAEAQEEAARLGIEEQRRQFDLLQETLKPYIEAGNIQLEQFGPYQRAGEVQLRNLQDLRRATLGLFERQAPAIETLAEEGIALGRGQIPALEEFAAVGPEALRQQRALAGLAGPEAQRTAISQIEADPAFQALAQQGEEAILQRASATGGLRGGDVQAALAQFRPQLLNQFINQQYQRLGGLTSLGGAATEGLYTSGYGRGGAAAERLFTSGLGTTTGIAGQLMSAGLGSQELLARLGQASAAGQAAGATSLGANIANTLGQVGAAQAQAAGTIGAAQAAGALGQAQAISNVASSIPNALIMSRFLQPSGTMVLGGGF